MQKAQDWGNGDGTGEQYDLLAGPFYSIGHIVAGLPIGYIVDRRFITRKKLLAIALFTYSISCVWIGYSTKYWQVAMGRIVLVCSLYYNAY